MKKILAMLLTPVVLLTGCVVVSEVPATRVIVTDGGGPPHCPPGQAKKGRC